MSLINNTLQERGWEKEKTPDLKTGQADILFVSNKSNEQGVFRSIRFKKGNTKFNQQTIERYKREIDILTDKKFSHDNIIRLLEHGVDEENQLYWYISSRGIRFEEWWKQSIRMKNDKEILLLAIKIINQVLSGLSIAHKNGVVHRDIKPDNLVVINDKVKIIDWGISYLKGEERISDADYPAYNRAFSPAYLFFNREKIPPWVDVFQTSQLFMWLLSDKPKKKITSTVFWKWAVYLPGIGETDVLKLSAFNSICSYEETCPKNATEAKIIFTDYLQMENDKKGNYDRLAEKLRSNALLKKVELTERIERIRKDIIPAISIFNRVVNKFDEVSSNLKSTLGDVIKIERKSAIDWKSLYQDEDSWVGFIKSRIENGTTSGGNNFGTCIEFGYTPMNQARISVEFIYDHRDQFKSISYLKDINPIPKVQIIVNCRLKNGPDLSILGFPLNGYLYSPETLYNNSGEKVKVSDLIQNLHDVISSENVWEKTK